jgi:hypothetical protein
MLMRLTPREVCGPPEVVVVVQLTRLVLGGGGPDRIQGLVAVGLNDGPVPLLVVADILNQLCLKFHQHFTSSFCADILLPKNKM